MSKYRINDEDSNDGNFSGNTEEEIQLLGQGDPLGTIEEGIFPPFLWLE